MMFEQKWNLLFLVLLFVGLVVGGKIYKTKNPICPDDFKDSKQELVSFSAWVKKFGEEDPNATELDLSKARRNFYIENNCTEALKRHDDFLAGNIDDETRRLTEMAIEEEISKNQRTPICPDEYENLDDYIKAVEQWVGDFYRKNPNITKDEMLSARKNFLFENGCVEL